MTKRGRPVSTGEKVRVREDLNAGKETEQEEGM